ncbi:hypothetical protein [Spiribacter roseus]|uniref:hypothetical protein n=1 Tax=Spiribacter roseus TaxID=1855875 RepID=UPI00349F19BB
MNHATGAGADTPEVGTVATGDRPLILCFVAYCLCGYCSGGSVRTIGNFVDHLADEFDIRIGKCDRDAVDTEPYPSVRVDAWNADGQVQVFCVSDKTVNLCGIAKLLRETPHDVSYFNSFFAFEFSKFSPLTRRLGWAPLTALGVGSAMVEPSDIDEAYGLLATRHRSCA